MGACASTPPPVVVDGVTAAPGAPWGDPGRGTVNPTRDSQRVEGDRKGSASEDLSSKIARASIAALAEAIPTATQYRLLDEETASKIAETMFALFVEGAIGVRDTPGGKRVAFELSARVKWKLDDATCSLLGEADKAMQGDCSEAELRAFVIAKAEAAGTSPDDMKRGLDRFQRILDSMNKVKWDIEISALEKAPAPSAAQRPAVSTQRVSGTAAQPAAAADSLTAGMTDEEKWAAEIAAMDGGGGVPPPAAPTAAAPTGSARPSVATQAQPSEGDGVSGAHTHDADKWAAEIAALGAPNALDFVR